MLLALAIGDALGNTSEGLTAADRESRYGEITDYLPNSQADGRRVGLPSDDSQLAFWTLESLLDRGSLDPDDLSARFASRQVFGIGNAVAKFLRNRAEGVTPWYRCGAESAGNGALMRIAPIVLLHPAGTSAALWLDTALASIVTHRDASSVASCVAFADLLARLLRAQVPPQPGWIIATFLATVRRVCADQLYRPRGGRFADWEGHYADYLEHALGEAALHGWSTREACDAWHSGAYLLETVPSVLWILRETCARSGRSDHQGGQRHERQRHGRRDRRCGGGGLARRESLALAMADGVARPDDSGRQRARVPADRGSGQAGLEVVPGGTAGQPIRWRRPTRGVATAYPW